MDDGPGRAHEIACAASSIVWGGELGWVRGDYRALIARLRRMKVDSDNLRFLHEEVYPLLGWDGGDTPPLTFLEELIDEVKDLRESKKHHLKMLDGAVSELRRLGIEADEYGGKENIATATRKVVDEVKDLRATAELVERAAKSGKMFRMMRLAINNNVSMWTAVIGTKTYPTLREALESLGETK